MSRLRLRLPALPAPIRRFFAAHRSLGVMVAIAIAGVALPLLSRVPPFGNLQSINAWTNAFTIALIYSILAIGLNVVIGFAGLLDLGYAAFFALGGYTYALLASPFFGVHLPFWPVLIFGALIGAIFGVLLGAPTLRLRGDYLAIVTLGFGEIVPLTLLNADKFTAGTIGIGGIDKPRLPGIVEFTLLNPWPFYVLILLMLALVVIVVFRLEDSKVGRAWEAIREDELAAESSGINTVVSKLQAFAVGAAIAGFAGVFNAAKLTVVEPDMFGFIVSVSTLSAVVLGGMGNVVGVGIGAFVIYLIQSILLKQLNILLNQLAVPILKDINFLQFQYVLYGIVLVLMMLKRPQGIYPARRRMRTFADTPPTVQGKAAKG
jgi:ABC-type branched-subunit amino acid transport system permease subunit